VKARHPFLVQKSRLRIGLDQEHGHLPVLSPDGHSQGRAAPVVAILEQRVQGEQPLDHVSVTAPDGPVKHGLPSAGEAANFGAGCEEPYRLGRAPGLQQLRDRAVAPQSGDSAVRAAGCEPVDHLPPAGPHRPAQRGIPVLRTGIDVHTGPVQQHCCDGDMPLCSRRVQRSESAGDCSLGHVGAALDEHLDHSSFTPTGRPRDRRPPEQVVGVGVRTR